MTHKYNSSSCCPWRSNHQKQINSSPIQDNSQNPFNLAWTFPVSHSTTVAGCSEFVCMYACLLFFPYISPLQMTSYVNYITITIKSKGIFPVLCRQLDVKPVAKRWLPDNVDASMKFSKWEIIACTLYVNTCHNYKRYYFLPSSLLYLLFPRYLPLIIIITLLVLYSP